LVELPSSTTRQRDWEHKSSLAHFGWSRQRRRGLGSIGGSVVAAIVMGVASSVVSALASPIWSDFTFFIVLLLVLLLRPRGLFGARLRGAL